MKQGIRIRSILLALLASVVGMLLLVTWLPPLALALPPRPTPEPTPTPRARRPNGAIELTVESSPVGLWTVVQWQDALDGWHDVGGWQGTLDAGDRKTWWVDEDDYGKGPFRWMVTQGGELMATSEPFYLPDATGQIIRVLVSLAP